MLFLDCPPLFDRAGIYNESGVDYADNARALRLALGRRRGLARRGRPQPHHIVHAHDWQAGLVAGLSPAARRSPATVFTIHNLAYQGIFDKAWVPRLGLGWA